MSGNFENQEKVSESWKKMIKGVELGKRNVVDASQSGDLLSGLLHFIFILGF